jgi:hypothetical protein
MKIDEESGRNPEIKTPHLWAPHWKSGVFQQMRGACACLLKVLRFYLSVC